jgi:hypothetical protein
MTVSFYLANMPWKSSKEALKSQKTISQTAIMAILKDEDLIRSFPSGGSQGRKLLFNKAQL